VANAEALTGIRRRRMPNQNWLTMTPEERINEPGNEPDCPFCGKPRVTRSTYIRCNRCGVNWSNGVDIFRDPRLKPIIEDTSSSKPEAGNTAQPANATSVEDFMLAKLK
jgi:hypothetical protein